MSVDDALNWLFLFQVAVTLENGVIGAQIVCVCACGRAGRCGGRARSPRVARHGGGREAALVPAAGAAQLARRGDRRLAAAERDRAHARGHQPGGGRAAGGLAVARCAARGGQAAAGGAAHPAGGRHVRQRAGRRRGRARWPARRRHALHAGVGAARGLPRGAAGARVRLHAAPPPQRRGWGAPAAQVRALPAQAVRTAARGDRQLYLR